MPLDIETDLAQGSQNWHETLNTNFAAIEQEVNGISSQQFDQTLNTDDDVEFNTVAADNLAIQSWNTAYSQSVTAFALDGATLTLTRRNAPNLTVNIAGTAGAVPSAFKHETQEFSFPGSGSTVSHSLGVKPWGIEIWARLETSKGGWTTGEEIYMSSHFESGGENWSFIIQADDSHFTLTSRSGSVLVLSDKDGTSNRSEFISSEVTFIAKLWAWDIPDD